jgi:hypothetical protein
MSWFPSLFAISYLWALDPSPFIFILLSPLEMDIRQE